MDRVAFVKYTAYGNNFVIIDETRHAQLSETEKPQFAYPATNAYFGVGSDNLLIIQPCTQQILKTINNVKKYWKQIPDAGLADYIFRMFEPDGEEALCCGNGLMCIANFLFHRYGIDSTRIMTEIPTERPKTITIGTDVKLGTNWANMGHPRRMPASLMEPSAASPHDDVIDHIESLTVNFRAHDLRPFTDKCALELSGYLVFTGEPHLVVYTDSGISIKELRNLMFVRSCLQTRDSKPTEKRVAFGSWLIQHIGNSVNKHYRNIFPAGLNINFAQVNGTSGQLEYRCFERGIFRETLACGTGALAVSFVSHRLKRIHTDTIRIQPHRCRWELADAEILVRRDGTEWFLNGNPTPLFEGEYWKNPPAIAHPTEAGSGVESKVSIPAFAYEKRAVQNI